MNYRDDHQDVAIAGDGVWLNLTTVMTDIAKTASTALVGLAILLSDTAVASNSVTDRAYYLADNTALIADTSVSTVYAVSEVQDNVKAKDTPLSSVQVGLTDTARVVDNVDTLPIYVSQAVANVTDEIIATRTSQSVLEDIAKVSDTGGQFAYEMADDIAVVSDNAFDTARFKQSLTDTVKVNDEATSSVSIGTGKQDFLTDTAKACDEVYTTLYARTTTTDYVIADDEFISLDKRVGQAWTANTDNWAMSRYAPYGYEQLVVINGKLYGIDGDGVHELNVINESVTGSIKTGQMDITGGNLSYPTGCYLEYEMAGKTKQAIMAVNTTQKGGSQTYKYKLPTEKADYLTNGRFIFGRGLRGRHFGFELTLTGTYAHINDMAVDVASGKRRV